MVKPSIDIQPHWKVDPNIDFDRVTLEDAKFVFAQAEKRLDDTIKTGELIASKTMTIMTWLTGLLVALSGYFISNWKGWPHLDPKEVTGMAGLIYILSLFSYMVRNVLPNEYLVLGSDPSELMLPEFFDESVPKDKITTFLYISEIENYDFRINYNRKKISKDGRDIVIRLFFSGLCPK